MDSTYILLQHYWWFLVSLLGALLVFLLFVQGGQSLLFTIGKTELEQKMLEFCFGDRGKQGLCAVDEKQENPKRS